MLRPTLLLTAVALLVAPAAASAVTVERTGDDIYVTSEAGEDNDLQITEVGGTHIVVRDNGNTELPLGGGCFVSGPAVRCPVAGLDDIIVDVGAGENAVQVYAPYYVSIDGSASSKNAFDAEGAEHAALFGGPGDDTLIGSDGVDSITGSAGHDTLTGREGADTIIGGSGADTIDGGADADTIDGGSSGDDISGGGGIDKIFAVDGFVDTIDCAGDADEITRDSDDALSFCVLPPAPPAVPEQPVEPSGPGGGASPGGAGPSQSAAAAAKLAIDTRVVHLTSKRDARIKLNCSGAACSGTLKLTRKVNGKTVVLGRARYSVSAGKSRVVKVRVSKSTARRIGRKGLKVTATAGSSKRTITIKKGRS